MLASSDFHYRMVPGAVSTWLPAAFAVPAAYGDYGARRHQRS